MAIEQLNNASSNVAAYQTTSPVKPDTPSIKTESPVLSKDNQEKRKSQKDEETFRNKAREINKIVNKNAVAEFAYNESAHRISIKLKDKETNEVIKEIPSEEALDLLARAWEIAGTLVDEKR